MTKDELLALIAAKIDGQGSQVDIGGALGDILRGVLDLIPAAPEVLTFEAPLEKADGEVSLKIAPTGGLQATDDGLGISRPRFVIHGHVEEDADSPGEYHAYVTLTPSAGYVPKLGDMVEVEVDWPTSLPSDDCVTWNGVGIGYLSAGPTILYVSEVVPNDAYGNGSWVLADKHNLTDMQQAAAIAFDSPVIDLNGGGTIPLAIEFNNGNWIFSENS